MRLGSLAQRLIWTAVGLGLLALVSYELSQAGIRPIKLLETALLPMTPLVLAAVGECVNERAGVINIGIEGIFLITAVLGVFWAEVLGSGLLGILMGGIFGAIIGGILGVISTYGRADQIIAGIGLNVMSLGLVQYLLMAIWAFPGIHVFPRELVLPRIALQTPIGVLRISPMTIAAIIIALLTALLLYKTLIGLRIRAAGDKPEAVDVAGISVNRVRISASIFAGFLAGLGGAFMPLAWFGGLVKEISAGRGFIALAAVVFAGLNPILALAASFIFGFAEGLAFAIAVTPGVKEVMPFHFVQMTPYLVTIITLAIFVTSRRFPRALGKPYIRE
ncbi:MAG: ABC transporter permease [Aigarchaeota archaeon]|nr:ABC transporter permease [Candidatus Pelearchaeum maunauluense]